MNILLINKYFFLKGGSEKVFFQERQYLIDQEHAVYDFSMSDSRNLPSPYSSYFVPNINFHNANIIQKLTDSISFIHSSNALNSIRQLLKTISPEIAHCHNIYHQLTPSILPELKKKGVKLVLTLHDYKLSCPAYISIKNDEICTACEGKYFLKPIISHCQNSRIHELMLSAESFWHKYYGSYDCVDIFLAPSKFMANQISKRIPLKKVRILPNGVDTTTLLPRYSDAGYALYFGRISKEKGILTLLEAHNSLKKSLPLKIVGTGPLLKKLSLSYPSVEFIGFQTGQVLHDLIANAAFVVVPSEWYENCSMAVLESMVLGKPIIGSCIGGLPEQIEDNKTGFLFEMGNSRDLAKKMEILIHNHTLRISMGKAARAKVENEFSMKVHFESLIQIYEELLH
jgi:glycosyltransferase involved in cell wall biosynthesis